MLGKDLFDTLAVTLAEFQAAKVGDTLARATRRHAGPHATKGDRRDRRENNGKIEEEALVYTLAHKLAEAEAKTLRYDGELKTEALDEDQARTIGHLL